MSCTAFNPGSVEFLKCDLISTGRVLDIREYVVRFELYESILASGSICEITLADSTGIFSSFGNDTVDFAFTTHPDAPPVAYKMRIVKTGPGRAVTNERAVLYKITCVSEETYKSMTIKNLPLVRSKDVLVEEAIVAMLNDVLETEKDISIEPSSGLHSVSSAGKTPFEFINDMRKIAVSKEHKASAYVFYENKDGYTFKSLEQLVKDSKTSIGDRVYFNHNVANLVVTGSNWRTIIGSKQIQVGNDEIAGLIGGNKNDTSRFDYVNGTLENYDEDASAAIETVSMNEGSAWIDTKRIDKYKRAGRHATILYDGTTDKNTVAEKENFLPYYLTKFLTVIQHITVYGDTTVTCGQLIKCHFPKRTGLTEESTEMDENLSGNYMICKCRHTLVFAQGQSQYVQSFEIVKDGLGGDVPRKRG